MNTQEAIAHLHNGLLKIHEEYKDASTLSLSAMFRINKLPKDYIKILKDEGVLYNTWGGKRGAGKYLWIGGEPTEDNCRKYIVTYNQMRLAQSTALKQVKKADIDSLNKKVDAIIKHFKIKI